MHPSSDEVAADKSKPLLMREERMVSAPVHLPSDKKIVPLVMREEAIVSGPGDLSTNKKVNASNELPDLMPRIEEMGWADQYLRFRQGYMNWRQGKAHGAKGEHTEEGFTKENEKMLSFWYPTYKAWEARRTVSFWITVFFLEGSFLFAFTGFVGTNSEPWGDLAPAVTAQATLAGHIWYILGCYLMVFAVINLKRDSDEIWINPFRFREAVAHVHTIDLHVLSYIIANTYFWGALNYCICVPADCFEEHLKPYPWLFWTLSTLTNFIGSELFFLGGILEVFENELFTSNGPAWNTEQFCAVMCNLMGGFLFGLGGVLPFLAKIMYIPGYASGLCYGLGACGYVGNSLICLFLWKDEQFGLSYVAQLNKLRQMAQEQDEESNLAESDRERSQSSRSPAPKQKGGRKKHELSFRGLFMVFCYSFFSTVCEVNFIVSFYNEATVKDDFLGAYSHLVPFILFQCLLVLQSAVVRLPPEQPYRCLLIFTRIFSLLMGAKLVFNFFDMCHVHFGMAK